MCEILEFAFIFPFVFVKTCISCIIVHFALGVVVPFHRNAGHLLRNFQNGRGVVVLFHRNAGHLVRDFQNGSVV